MITDPAYSAALGEVCGRAAGVEVFEDHGRAADLQVTVLGGVAPKWAGGLIRADT